MEKGFIKEDFLPKQERKTILFIADDIRFPSGVANQARKIVENTIHRYNYILVGSGVNHPEAGKIVDLSKHYSEITGVEDASVVLFPYNGYGDLQLYRNIIRYNKVDALLHFTDPRFYQWLYNAEIEIRKDMPVLYYALWDCPPAPLYNKNYYASCDTIISISKQSHSLHKEVLDAYKAEKKIKFKYPKLYYTPHAIDHQVYKPLPDKDIKKLRQELAAKLNMSSLEFTVLWNNRNANRKQPGDAILAFKMFYNQIVAKRPDLRGNILFYMKTEDSSNHGTDLRAILKDLAPECNVMIDSNKYEDESDINKIYNIADVTMNLASNEGFGLSGAESIMAGTPIINNVTGGLQDHCGFKNEDGKYLSHEDYVILQTNSKGVFKKHGEWAYPVYPRGVNLIGSPLTPYIFEEKPDIEGFASALVQAFKDKNMLKINGKKGREFALNDAKFNVDNLSKCFIQYIDEAIEDFKNNKTSTYQTIKL